jgi:hypothetical protein
VAFVIGTSIVVTGVIYKPKICQELNRIIAYECIYSSHDTRYNNTYAFYKVTNSNRTYAYIFNDYDQFNKYNTEKCPDNICKCARKNGGNLLFTTDEIGNCIGYIVCILIGAAITWTTILLGMKQLI